MSKREAGRFRGKLFGGFHREDVLTYIASVYSELDQLQAENEALRAHLEELGVLDAVPEVGVPIQSEIPYSDDSMLEGHEDLDPPAAPSMQQAVDPMPPVSEAQPLQEASRLRPSLSNPYPERAKRVKVRPAKEQG